MKYRQGLHAQKAGALVASENMIVFNNHILIFESTGTERERERERERGERDKHILMIL